RQPLRHRSRLRATARTHRCRRGSRGMSDNMISVEEFAAGARSWIAATMPPADPGAGHFFFTDQSSRTDADDLARIDRCRELQRLLFDGGFAGIVVAPEY